MRHAKSSWAAQGLGDHERPLNERGRRDAPRVAARLAELGWAPDGIWSSDAERTRETAALMLPDLGGEPSVTFDAELYLAGLPALRKAAGSWEAGWSTVLALGHNPGWEDAASALSGSHIGMTTANAVLLESAGDAPDWAAALSGEWTLVDVVRPKEL